MGYQGRDPDCRIELPSSKERGHDTQIPVRLFGHRAVIAEYSCAGRVIDREIIRGSGRLSGATCTFGVMKPAGEI